MNWWKKTFKLFFIFHFLNMTIFLNFFIFKYICQLHNFTLILDMPTMQNWGYCSCFLLPPPTPSFKIVSFREVWKVRDRDERGGGGGGGGGGGVGEEREGENTAALVHF